MEKRQTWFLFFDLDGTLAQNDCPPSPGTVRALRSARAAGHKVFLCTGRVKCDIYKEIWDIGFDGAICGAGTHIYTPKRRILCETIPLLLLRQAVEVMRTYHITGVLAGVHRLYIVPGEKRLPWRMQPVCSGRELSKTMEIQFFTMHLTGRTQFEAVRSALNGIFECYPNADFTFCEFVLKGYDKCAGMRRMLKSFGWSEECTLAVGDSLNDYDLLRAAHWGVAMGQAQQALKGVADYVTEPFELDGAARAVDYFLRCSQKETG